MQKSLVFYVKWAIFVNITSSNLSFTKMILNVTQTCLSNHKSGCENGSNTFLAVVKRKSRILPWQSKKIVLHLRRARANLIRAIGLVGWR